jgi:hypothetical protein
MSCSGDRCTQRNDLGLTVKCLVAEMMVVSQKIHKFNFCIEYKRVTDKIRCRGNLGLRSENKRT